MSCATDLTAMSYDYCYYFFLNCFAAREKLANRDHPSDFVWWYLDSGVVWFSLQIAAVRIAKVRVNCQRISFRRGTVSVEYYSELAVYDKSR